LEDPLALPICCNFQKNLQMAKNLQMVKNLQMAKNLRTPNF
jgi:hypothetical protein